MTTPVFAKQIERLRGTYGERAYPKERMSLFWLAFERVTDEVFSEAVDELIATNRSAPLLREIESAVSEAKVRDAERRRLSGAGYLETLRDAQAKAPNQQTKEFAKGCVDLVTRLTSRKISKEHFLQACDMLDLAAREMNRGFCGKCGGDGYVRALNTKQNEILHLCDCPTGMRHPNQIGPYSDGSAIEIGRAVGSGNQKIDR